MLVAAGTDVAHLSLCTGEQRDAAGQQLVYRAAARLQLRLASLDPESYGLPHDLPERQAEPNAGTVSVVRLGVGSCYKPHGAGAAADAEVNGDARGGAPSTAEPEELTAEAVWKQVLHSLSIPGEAAERLKRPWLRDGAALPPQQPRQPRQPEAQSAAKQKEQQQQAMEALRARLRGDTASYNRLSAAALPTEARPMYEHFAGQRSASAGSEVNVAPFELSLLGTGCKSPSRVRNCAALLLRLPAVAAGAGSVGFSVLIDAGEGCLAALRRQLGWAGAARVLSALDMVWVSHMHADHHAGLPAVLDARRAALAERADGSAAASAQPLLIVGPAALGRLLGAQSPSEAGGRWSFAANAAFNRGDHPLRRMLGRHMAPAGGTLAHLASLPVNHCPDAWGLVLATAAGCSGRAPLTLVYSGDTTPAPSLVAAGRQWAQQGSAVLLVHEATFLDTAEGREHAVRKRHSTVADAVGAGCAIGAWRTVLTHFSNRHPSFPVPAPALGHHQPRQGQPVGDDERPAATEGSGASCELTEELAAYASRCAFALGCLCSQKSQKVAICCPQVRDCGAGRPCGDG